MLRPERVTDNESEVVLWFTDKATADQLLAVADWLTVRINDCSVDRSPEQPVITIKARRIVGSFYPRDAAKLVRNHLSPRYWAVGRLRAEVLRHNGVNHGVVYILTVYPHDKYADPQLETQQLDIFQARFDIGRVRYQPVASSGHQKAGQLRFTLQSGLSLTPLEVIRPAAAMIGVELRGTELFVDGPQADYDLFEHFRSQPGSVFEFENRSTD